MKEFPYPWKYPAPTRSAYPPGVPVACYDCFLPYPEGNDCVLSDDIWELINPSESEGGGILAQIALCGG